MGGLEPSLYAEQRLFHGYWCKHKCRWLFKVVWVAWIAVSWKLGTVDQWNLVHVQMGPLRGSSNVHTNSISRGAYYQKESADMKDCFPGCSIINAELDVPGAARPSGSWVVWGDECDWVNAPWSLYCRHTEWRQAKAAISKQWLESTLLIYCTSSLYTLAGLNMETAE